jgi:hypothetical protein
MRMVLAPVARAMVCDGAEIAYQLARWRRAGALRMHPPLARDGSPLLEPRCPAAERGRRVLLIDHRRHGALSREAAPLPVILSLLEIPA